MSTPTSGQGGSGETTVYELAAGESATIEALSFTVTTNATAGTHAVQVALVIPGAGTIGPLMDLNIGGPSQVNTYTYGLGLNASACSIGTGLAVTDALPFTTLPPGSAIVVTPVNATGAEITGDRIHDVLLMLDNDQGDAQLATLQPIGLMPGAQAA